MQMVLVCPKPLGVKRWPYLQCQLKIVCPCSCHKWKISNLFDGRQTDLLLIGGCDIFQLWNCKAEHTCVKFSPNCQWYQHVPPACFCAPRWWHCCVSGSCILLWVNLRPCSSLRWHARACTWAVSWSIWVLSHCMSDAAGADTSQANWDVTAPMEEIGGVSTSMIFSALLASC